MVIQLVGQMVEKKDVTLVDEMVELMDEMMG
jgi:hypothetical protein